MSKPVLALSMVVVSFGVAALYFHVIGPKISEKKSDEPTKAA